MAREYRELTARIPTKAMLRAELTDDEYERALDELYHYIDLSNDQVFLRQRERISLATWENWRDGIRSNLNRPAFARAWREIKERSDNFSELRRLEAGGFQSDPAEWREVASIKRSQPIESHLPAEAVAC
jgi:hypothetical protein